MSKKKIFDNIMNNFQSEDDEDDDDNEEEKYQNNNNIKGHKQTSSLTENTSNKINEIMSNGEKENNKIINSHRDKFGYFTGGVDNEDENEGNEESNSSNKNNENIYDSSFQNYTSGKENDNSSSEEEKSDKLNKSKKNISDGDSENQNNSYSNVENYNKNKNIKENNNNENNVNDEQNDLINALYQNNKLEYFDSMGEEELRMHSFKPNPVPLSPKFSKNTNNNNMNLITLNDMITYKNPINNLMNNNSLKNFTETIETKIEGDMKNSIKENQNNINPTYTHNDKIISLGKISEENKNIYDEEREEEEFLLREELKRQKNNQNKEIINNNKKDEKEEKEKEKENTNEDEEENEILNKLKINYNNQTEENNNILNNGINKLKEHLTKDEGTIKNKNINDKNNSQINKELNNKKNDIERKDISIDISNNYKKADDSQRSLRPSEKNTISNNNDSNLDESYSNKNNNNIKNNVYAKKTASKKNNNKGKNKIPSSRNSKYNSPLNKNNTYKNNDINSSENKNQFTSMNKKNNSAKKNSHNVNTSYSKQNSKIDRDLNNSKKNLFTPKNEIKSRLYEPKQTTKINYTPENYPFKPKINPKSREIYETKVKNKRSKSPIGKLLYEEANIKKEKMNQIDFNEKNNIKSNANIKKINNNSYNMVILRIKKKIDNSIKKYSKSGKLSIVGLTQCLFDFNIITELIKIKDNIQDVNDDLDIVELQSIIESINTRDKKKLNEVELVEQLWFKINPSNSQYINSQILSEILKILMSSNNNVKDLIDNIEKIFQKYNINKKDYNNENNDNKYDESHSSPLRDKTYYKEELWPLSKLIKIFLNLKKNLNVYSNHNNIIKKTDKDLTFQPELISNDYFYKYSKYDYYKHNSNYTSPNKNNNNNNSKKKKHDFDKVFERFMYEKELHEKTLERIREIKKEKELKMCTNVPKINKHYIPRSPNRNFKKKNKTIESEDSKILIKNKSNLNIKIPVYEKLYNLRTNINDNNKNILDENCTFKPNLISNQKKLKQIFNSKEKPRGYDDYVERNKSLLKKNEYEKKLNEEKISGQNYDKIKNMKIKPFNITDLNESNNKKKKTINIEDEDINDLNKNKDNIIDDVFITLNIRIPNGLSKPLKIYDKDYNDTVESVNNFCKTYSINDENKKIIFRKVMEYKNVFFSRNIIDYNNRNGFMLNEDLDTITNTYSNNNDP